ncbi:GLPGLI family protein [Flavobacterium rakeshii]|uniref:GLPGLI family protein n=1 Tax=Flavobacterium rakeshii TaxID=1038845 RepID=A0A6N8HGA9_9FLAO|nr:GLPGLI family protein [Flavobacterium rakeshii]MUV04721.1 GLPGLI family protein [Flavobacterium rakeshii]
MKLTSIIILLISTSFCLAQKKIAVEVEYQELQEIPDLKEYTSSYTTLYANSNVAVNKVYDDVEFYDRPLDNKDFKASDPNKVKKFSGKYLMINTLKKQMLFFDFIMKNNFLVEDIYHDFKWDISNENKIIEGYNCIMATTKYRGRNWKVWFTPDIPLPFGPWKLHGLPGLIIEAVDEKHQVSYKAVKIINAENALLSEDFDKLVKTRNKKPITYKHFLEIRTEAFENLSKELNSENSGATFEDVKIPRSGPELKYEWEE